MNPVQFTDREKSFILLFLVVFMAGCVFRQVRDARVRAALQAWQRGQDVSLREFITARRDLTVQPQVPENRKVPSPKARLVGRLDLNSATAEELEALERIGPVLASRIIDQRQKLGGFRSVEDLLQVKGIGKKTLARIQGEVCVRGRTAQ